MRNNTPIDEYFFWKTFVDEKQKKIESIPRVFYELLDKAEAEMLFYLIEKRKNTNKDKLENFLIH